MSVVAYEVSLASVGERSHVVHRCGFGQLLRLQPSRKGTLPCRVSGGDVRVSVIVALVHKIPCAHAVASAVVSVVHVGKSETVGELVAYGADAVYARLARHLAAAGIGVDTHAVERHVSAQRAEQLPLVRPDGALVASGSLSPSGVEEEHLVHLSVTVPVIFCEVDVIVDSQKSRLEHLSYVGVVVRSVVCIAFWHAHRTGDVEAQEELSVALVAEVVTHRPYESHVVTEVVLVQYAVVQSHIVTVAERHVGKLDKDDETLFLAHIRRVVSAYGHV